jgi:hypothetical protein
LECAVSLRVARWLSFIWRSYNCAITVLLTEIAGTVVSVVPARFIDRELGEEARFGFQE